MALHQRVKTVDSQVTRGTKMEVPRMAGHGRLQQPNVELYAGAHSAPYGIHQRTPPAGGCEPVYTWPRPPTPTMPDLSLPPPLPPLVPHTRYGRTPVPPGWLFFGAARQALKFLALRLRAAHPDLLFIAPAYTCDSVVQAIDESGAELGFVDVDASLDFDLAALTQLIGQHTGRPIALVPTPLFGAPVRRYKPLFPDCIVIEDRAQTVPDPASQADYQLLSFGPGKQVSGMGGGALIGAQALQAAHQALAMEGGTLKHQAMARVGGLLLGPAWSLAGQRVAQRHAQEGLDKQAHAIAPAALCEGRAQWISHSLATWDPVPRISAADRYHQAIAADLRFDIPAGQPYLRYPVRARLDGPGVSDGAMYEKVVERAETMLGRPLPGARALVQASLLPTHAGVTPAHIAWYASQLSGRGPTPI